MKTIEELREFNLKRRVEIFNSNIDQVYPMHKPKNLMEQIEEFELFGWDLKPTPNLVNLRLGVIERLEALLESEHENLAEHFKEDFGVSEFYFNKYVNARIKDDLTYLKQNVRDMLLFKKDSPLYL